MASTSTQIVTSRRMSIYDPLHHINMWDDTFGCDISPNTGPSSISQVDTRQANKVECIIKDKWFLRIIIFKDFYVYKLEGLCWWLMRTKYIARIRENKLKSLVYFITYHLCTYWYARSCNFVKLKFWTPGLTLI